MAPPPLRAQAVRFVRGIPPVAGLAGATLIVIALFGGASHPAAAGLFGAPWDKLAHLAVYGAVAAGVACTFAFRRPWLSVAIVAAIALADEWHQSAIPGRVASPGDLAADVIAAVLVTWLLYVWCARE